MSDPTHPDVLRGPSRASHPGHPSDPLAHTVTIGQLATLAGVSRRAIRHYEQQGLLPPPERTASGYRRYPLAAVIHLTRIRRLRELGLGVAQIREALAGEVWSSVPLRETLVQLERDLAARVQRLRQLHEQVCDIIATGADDLAAARAWRRLYTQARDGDTPAQEADGQTSMRTNIQAGMQPSGQMGQMGPLSPTLADLLDLAGAIGGEALVRDMRARLAEPEALAQLGHLGHRLKALGRIPLEANEREREAEVESLAAALAAALPLRLLPGPLAEPAMLLILLGERPALLQVRCLERAWQVARQGAHQAV